MSLSSLDILAISNDAPTLVTLKTKIPARLDNQIWGTDYTVVDTFDEESGAPAVYIEVRFILAADRLAALNEINALSNLKPNLLDGSFIGKHKCFHDEGLPCNPRVILWSR